MKKILIISPHYPPSNLAAVHRSRLFALHLPHFGWEPIILTVHEDYYEETLDRNLEKLLPDTQRIEKVKAFRVTRPRLIGDIGIRGFLQLLIKAKNLVRKEKIDFVYIPIPSFYVSLIGAYLHYKTGVKYGIDYIDPWVHKFPGSENILSRHWISTQLAKWLEPRAVKHAVLITGVAEGYYKGVQERNPYLLKTCVFGAMPYGGEEADHQAVKSLGLKPYLFQKNKKLQLVYAGTMLPKAYSLLNNIFQSIATNREIFEQVEFHFIGTGKTPNDPKGYNVKPLAEKYGLWETVIFEYPNRIPYLDVLTQLEAASGIFILGSTEPHYTPSKTYQGVLSGKPIFAVLHNASTAVDVLRSSNAGVVLAFDDGAELYKIGSQFIEYFHKFLLFKDAFRPEQVDMGKFNTYSASAVTKMLTDLINSAMYTK
jgi:hypothetical protein